MTTRSTILLMSEARWFVILWYVSQSSICKLNSLRHVDKGHITKCFVLSAGESNRLLLLRNFFRFAHGESDEVCRELSLEVKSGFLERYPNSDI